MAADTNIELPVQASAALFQASAALFQAEEASYLIAARW